MDEKENVTDSVTYEESEPEVQNIEIKPCFHRFVDFRNRRKCIICGMEIDK